MRFYLRQIRLNSQGYTYGKWGRYYGTGLPLYEAESEDGSVYREFRAYDRESAKENVKAAFPDATFFN